MDGNKFDQITKSLASGLSRRQMIKGAAGALGALVGIRHEADAACRTIRHPCEGTQQCCTGLSCVEASFEGQSERCCPPGQSGCGLGCCPIGQCCQQGNLQVCLAAGQCCTAATCPTPTNPCKVATCTAGVCGEANIANGTSCNDGNACTSGDTCQAGVCTGGTSVVCTALDQCHDVGVCDPATGICSNPNKTNGTSCNDGNACTTGDTCQAGICTGGTATVCTALDQCHDAGVCDPATGICSNPEKANGTSCSDNNACTQTDTCQAGVCTPGTNVVCSPLDQCHVAGVCDPATGLCSNPTAADGTTCDDGDACTQTDTCVAGVCTGSDPVICTASDQCHVPGVCDPDTGTCSNPDAPEGTTCSDGNACTQTDTCVAGVCTGGNPVVCTASDQCHVPGVCDTTTGICSNPAAADGTSCNDGNACTQTDTCQAGACVGGNPVVCTALDQCHDVGVCDTTTGACSNPAKPDGTSCGDGLFCNGNETCQGGICTPGVNPCNAAICQTCDEATDSCVGCPANTHCEGGSCVPDTKQCTSAKDCPGAGKCCCFNSRSQKGTCSDITGCGNGTNLACLPA